MPMSAIGKVISTAIVLLVITGLGAVSRGYGQVAGGTISGTVSDSTGRVIADADVVIKNTATGVTRETKTNSDGLYTAPNLVP
ncbi:MAG: carboxypeptidase regulatory-like domain-containing protein, partial [Acidobacteria bacterium]|nr:carboxypeptidase regulatory-like domain-containing protein [Acidobacteriota bacterium]